jgi:hypothetical protein
MDVMLGYLGSPIAILPTMSTIRLATDTRLAGRTLMFFPRHGALLGRIPWRHTGAAEDSFSWNLKWHLLFDLPNRISNGIAMAV